MSLDEEIAKFRSLDSKSATLSDLEQALRPIFNNYRIGTPIISPGQKLYRGVRYVQKPQLVTEVSYPKSEIIKKHGRINLPGEPVFYGSVSRSAVSFELRLKVGERAAISKWEFAERIVLNNVGFTDSAFAGMGSQRKGSLWWQKQFPGFSGDRDHRINEFLSLEFTKSVGDGNELEYKKSIAISRILLHEMEEDAAKAMKLPNSKFGGILYPALQMKGHADNLALSPWVIDNHTNIRNVEYVEVANIADHGDYQSYNLKHLDYANSFSSNGEIQWKGRPARYNVVIPPGDFVTQSVEDGLTIYRDSKGRVIERE